MTTKKKTLRTDKEKLLKQGVNVNKSAIAAYKKLEKELIALGVETKPSYNLEHPLGPSKIPLRNRNR